MPLTGSQYRELINEYDLRRTRAESIRDENLRKLRDTIPEYARLEDEETTVAMDYGFRIINEPGLDLSDMDRALDDIHRRMDELLSSHGISPEDIEAPYTCPDCRDTGYIDNVKCHCFIQAELKILYDRSHIADLTERDNFSTMREDLFEGEDLEHFREAARTCREFVKDFGNTYENLMLVGSVGTGKSFLSSCIAHDLLEAGYSVLYFSASDFFDACADHSFGRGQADDDSVENDLTECDLLIIDDLGTEFDNQFTGPALFGCLNSRHNAHRPTLINTNLSLIELHDRYSDRIFSRLTGYYKIMKLTGPDLRMKLRTSSAK